DEGRTLVTVHAGPLLHYRDLASGRLVRVRQLGDFTPDAAALSADGRILAVARNGTVELWDVLAEKKLREFAANPKDPGGREPYLFRLTADGAAVLTAVEGRVVVHDVKTGAERLLHQQAA